MQQALPGFTSAQIADVMAQKGYTLQVLPGQYTPSYVLTNPQATQSGGDFSSGLTTSYGNQYSGDPTSLARGERVAVNKGYNVVGGIPTTKDQGTTPAGTGQYAVTVGTVNQRLDAKGAYKWVTYTTKDSNGNWVAVNRKVLRGGVTHQGKKNQAMHGGGQQQNQPQQQADHNQLVTLRANYG
jgi:hypothetical protein